MRIVLLGPPGAGKGSLASLLQKQLGVRHVSTGDIFRQEIARHSALGRRVHRYVTSGRLVPDRLVVAVMAARLNPAQIDRGIVLDGFPRTAGQAAGLDRVLKRRRRPLDGAVYLSVPMTVLVRRLTGRRVCPRCGANYHVRTMKPQRPGRCDRCAARLIIRNDDEPRTIRKRLRIDQAASRPLLAYYRRRGVLYRIKGAGPLDAVFERVHRVCRRHGWLG
ncbi:MAG: nucleoside monophosphate kinase [Candidatus Omnitrophica bacterium]|nr:nucleoside monophosphate kinase [Candidatus Omnitrophota bacterium]